MEKSSVHFTLLFYTNKKHLWIKELISTYLSSSSPIQIQIPSWPSSITGSWADLSKTAFWLHVPVHSLVPLFNKRSRQPYSITQFSLQVPCKWSHSAKQICTHQQGNLTHYFKTFNQEAEFHSIRNNTQGILALYIQRNILTSPITQITNRKNLII